MKFLYSILILAAVGCGKTKYEVTPLQDTVFIAGGTSGYTSQEKTGSVWITAFNNNIFISLDGGLSWSDIPDEAIYWRALIIHP